jgi:hypothetical protein
MGLHQELIDWLLNGHIVCGIFLLGCAILLGLRLRENVARIAWALLALAALTFSVAISLSSINIINLNIAHYYLGTKYAIPYSDTYKLFNAALARPQVGMRDLDNPVRLVRNDEREARAYYLELLRTTDTTFDPLASTAELRSLAIQSGAVEQEAEKLLKTDLSMEKMAMFRADARYIAERTADSRDITDDCGFNGSPFYAAVRHIDPTLYFPFGTGTAILNLSFQIVGALILIWIVGVALGCSVIQRLAMAAFLFSSWDFVGYALSGLVFAGLWLPIGIAVWAASRQRPCVAGGAIAWAGLMKLFPFILFLPAGLRFVRLLWNRLKHRKDNVELKWTARFLVAGMLSAAVLLVVSLASGRSWEDFFDKIVNQFQTNVYSLNDASFNSFLLPIGIADSVLPAIFAALSLAVIILIITSDTGEDFSIKLPRRLLVIASCGPLLFHTWFNYYAVVPLLLLPVVSVKNRWTAVVAAGVLAITSFIPEFDDQVLLAHPFWMAVKLAPFVLIPGWLLALEFAESAVAMRYKKLTIIITGIACLVVAADAWRMAEVRKLDEVGGQFLDAGQGQRAFVEYQSLMSLAPGNAMARMNAGIALIQLGRPQEAAKFFAAAVEMDPKSVDARQNYARLLMQAGKIDQAKEQISSALAVEPYNDELLFDLARIRVRQGQQDEAITLLKRAQELAPGNPRVTELILQLAKPLP